MLPSGEAIEDGRLNLVETCLIEVWCEKSRRLFSENCGEKF